MAFDPVGSARGRRLAISIRGNLYVFSLEKAQASLEKEPPEKLSQEDCGNPRLRKLPGCPWEGFFERLLKMVAPDRAVTIPAHQS